MNNLLSDLSLSLFGIIIPNSKLERGFYLLNSFHGISYSKTASIPRLGVLPGRTLEPRHLESNINATRTTKRDKFGIISIREAGLLRRLSAYFLARINVKRRVAEMKSLSVELF